MTNSMYIDMPMFHALSMISPHYHIHSAIRVSPSLDSFKRHLKAHYFASP